MNDPDKEAFEAFRGKLMESIADKLPAAPESGHRLGCTHEIQLQHIMGILAFIVAKHGGEMAIDAHELMSFVMPANATDRRALALDTQSAKDTLILTLMTLAEARNLVDRGATRYGRGGS